MSRSFIGTAEELDSDLVMIWHALNDWERIDGEWGQQVRNLKNDVRKRQAYRNAGKTHESPKMEWVKFGESWRVEGYPISVYFDFREFVPWEVYSTDESGTPLKRIVSFDTIEEAKAFVEKRCADIDRCEVEA